MPRFIWYAIQFPLSLHYQEWLLLSVPPYASFRFRIITTPMRFASSFSLVNSSGISFAPECLLFGGNHRTSRRISCLRCIVWGNLSVILGIGVYLPTFNSGTTMVQWMMFAILGLQILGAYNNGLYLHFLDLLCVTKRVWNSCVNEVAFSCLWKTPSWSIHGKMQPVSSDPI